MPNMAKPRRESSIVIRSDNDTGVAIAVDVPGVVDMLIVGFAVVNGEGGYTK